MTKLLTATYANGVLRPNEPLKLAEGSTVRIAVLDAADEGAWDAAAARAAVARILAMPLDGQPSNGEPVARDHDRYLYGDRRAPGRKSGS
jgi:predicted DNA-binding antitoxin AbrB/MazE fold protein